MSAHTPHDRVMAGRSRKILYINANLCDCCRYQRPPLPFEPEMVWQQSDLDLSTTAGFLHENCLHFLEDSAIQAAALESEFFSDAGAVLLPAQGLQGPCRPANISLFCMHAKIKQLLSSELADEQPLCRASSAGSTMHRVLGWTCTHL